MPNDKWKMFLVLCLLILLLPALIMVSFALPDNRSVRSTPMAISEDLLEILACPACKAKVELKPDGSGLKCVKCRRVYPIRDDIPVMLVDEASVEEEPANEPPEQP
jgi:uncharacterized protein YbaR (Trm112 family)